MTKLTWQVAALGASLLATQASAGDVQVLKTQKDTVSYSIGVQTGRQFKKDDIELNTELFVRGLKEGLAGTKPLLTDKELRKVMGSVLAEVRQKAALQRHLATLENKKKEETFLAANKAKDGVVALPSGVQYTVLKEGDGKKPTDADTVVVNYRGTLLDGTEFDATENGKPTDLKVATLIPGWKEALKMMPAGSKWHLVIPAQLAYGERGVGQDIGPNQTLLFDVELVAVK